MAGAIFAFAMTGILKMFILCTALDKANRNKSIAITHAEFVMEDIMEYLRNDANDINSLYEEIEDEDKKSWDWASANITSKNLTVLDSEFIDTAAPSGIANPLHITITVNWKDTEQAKTRSLELETLMSKR